MTMSASVFSLRDRTKKERKKTPSIISSVMNQDYHQLVFLRFTGHGSLRARGWWVSKSRSLPPRPAPLHHAPSSLLVDDDGGARNEALAVVVAAEEVAVIHLHYHRQDITAVEAEVAVVGCKAVVERLYQSVKGGRDGGKEGGREGGKGRERRKC